MTMKVVILGETDSGKTTLAGHFLVKCGFIDLSNEEIIQNERKSMKYASAFIQSAKRDNLNSPSIEFQINNSPLILIDSPGNRDYTKSLMQSVSIAKCVLLIISASFGEFECALSKSSQTRSQISLVAQSSTVEHLIILINKMDATQPAYSEDRFNEIQTEIWKLLKKIQYEPKTIVFIPISAWFGDNLTEQSNHMPWFSGTTVQSSLSQILSSH